MPLKKLPQETTEEESLEVVGALIRKKRWDFNISPRDKSGIDAEIEIVEGLIRTGKFLKCQVKAGASYITSENADVVRIRVETKYLQHWHEVNAPVILFFVHPADKKAYWKDIKAYLRLKPNLLSGIQATKTVEFHRAYDEVTGDTLESFKTIIEGRFHYGLISLEPESHEHGTSNVFPFLAVPPIWCAPTSLSHRVDAIEKIYPANFALTVHGDVMYSLEDLRDSRLPLRGLCNITQAVPRPWVDVDPNIVAELLSYSREITMQSRGLELAAARYTFSRELAKDQKRNKYSFPPLKGGEGESERTLVYIQKDSTGKIEYKHHAVRLSFFLIAESWHLEIDPDWFFSFPDRRTRNERGVRITREKAGMFNKEFLYTLHFWRQYLSGNSDVIRLKCGTHPLGTILEISTTALQFELPFRLANDYFGARINAVTEN